LSSPTYICILWYQTTVQNLKSVLKLYLETIGGGQKDGRTHTHQTKWRVSHNTSPLSVEGHTKPSAELEIKFQIPYNLDHFFQFPITFNNSFLPFQFPYPSIFATCYPFPEIFTSFPYLQNRANSPFYPSVRSSSPTYFTSTFIYNSADGLVPV
jgi:hypothetical protein